jgi:hypothetical protein
MKVKVMNSVSAINKTKIAGDIVKLRPHEAEPVASV